MAACKLKTSSSPGREEARKMEAFCVGFSGVLNKQGKYFYGLTHGFKNLLYKVSFNGIRMNFFFNLKN